MTYRTTQVFAMCILGCSVLASSAEAQLDSAAAVYGPASRGEVEIQMTALGSHMVSVRGQAVRRLGELGATDAVPALAQLLVNEESAEIRALCVDALGRIGSPEAQAALAYYSSGDVPVEVPSAEETSQQPSVSQAELVVPGEVADAAEPPASFDHQTASWSDGDQIPEPSVIEPQQSPPESSVSSPAADVSTASLVYNANVMTNDGSSSPSPIGPQHMVEPMVADLAEQPSAAEISPMPSTPEGDELTEAQLRVAEDAAEWTLVRRRGARLLGLGIASSVLAGASFAGARVTTANENPYVQKIGGWGLYSLGGYIAAAALLDLTRGALFLACSSAARRNSYARNGIQSPMTWSRGVNLLGWGLFNLASSALPLALGVMFTDSWQDINGIFSRVFLSIGAVLAVAGATKTAVGAALLVRSHRPSAGIARRATRRGQRTSVTPFASINPDGGAVVGISGRM